MALTLCSTMVADELKDRKLFKSEPFLGKRPLSTCSMLLDHLDAVLAQLGIERIAIIDAIAMRISGLASRI
jgi:hypothetical protein